VYLIVSQAKGLDRYFGLSGFGLQRLPVGAAQSYF
jgi:hypothetical protein